MPKKLPPKKRIRRPWKERFIKALAVSGNVLFASKAAGIDRRTSYEQCERDPAFKAAFEEAREQAADRLEQEAYRRAHDGVRKPICVNKRTLWVREYSDTLLIFLLKAARPGKYRDNHQIALSNPDGSKIEIDARQQTVNLFMSNPAAAEHLIALANLTCQKPAPAAMPVPQEIPHTNGNGSHNGNGNGTNGTGH